MRNSVRRVRWVRRGTTVVETAVVAPLILAGLFGAMVVGYAFMARQSVTLAAREGARAGVLPGANSADVNARVDSVMQGVGISGYSTNVDMGTPENPDVSVTVSLPFDQSVASAGFFQGTLDIESTAVMRKEGAASDEEEDTGGTGIEYGGS